MCLNVSYNQEKKMAIIMVTHDRKIVKKMKKRVILLDAGRILKDYEEGTYKNENI